MDEVLYRKGKVEELEEVYSLFLRVKKALKEINLDVWQGDDYPTFELFKEDLEKGAVVAVIDNKIVGFMAYEKYRSDNFFENEEESDSFLNQFGIKNDNLYDFGRLMVDPDHRKKGIGTGLLETARADSKGNVMFIVHDVNERAAKLYKEIGYRYLGDFDFVFGKFKIFYYPLKD